MAVNKRTKHTAKQRRARRINRRRRLLRYYPNRVWFSPNYFNKQQPQATTISSALAELEKQIELLNLKIKQREKMSSVVATPPEKQKEPEKSSAKAVAAKTISEGSGVKESTREVVPVEKKKEAVTNVAEETQTRVPHPYRMHSRVKPIFFGEHRMDTIWTSHIEDDGHCRRHAQNVCDTGIQLGLFPGSHVLQPNQVLPPDHVGIGKDSLYHVSPFLSNYFNEAFGPLPEEKPFNFREAFGHL
jgi:hypothetical protein